MSRIRISLLLLCATVLLASAPDARATVGWEHFAAPTAVATARLLSPSLKVLLEYEYGRLDLSDLANFSSYRITGTGTLDTYRRYRYALRSENTNGFRLGVRLRDQLDLYWTRMAADSRYQVWVDGEEQVSDPEGVPRVDLPKVHLRQDILSAGWHIRSVQWQRISPTVHAGVGWTLTSQGEGFQATYRPSVDNSDSRLTLELGGGLDWNWRKIEIGIDVRTSTFRWESEDNQVPASQIWTWTGSLHGGILF